MLLAKHDIVKTQLGDINIWSNDENHIAISGDIKVYGVEYNVCIHFSRFLTLPATMQEKITTHSHEEKNRMWVVNRSNDIWYADFYFSRLDNKNTFSQKAKQKTKEFFLDFVNDYALNHTQMFVDSYVASRQNKITNLNGKMLDLHEQLENLETEVQALEKELADFLQMHFSK